jgi:hypothetical protein
MACRAWQPTHTMQVGADCAMACFKMAVCWCHETMVVAGKILAGVWLRGHGGVHTLRRWM